MKKEFLAQISEPPQLPTLPVIAIRVLELTRREDVSIAEIANLIITDPSLASKILRTVNSPFYGRSKQVSTISNALVILGLQAAKTLSLGFSLLSDLKKSADGKTEHTFDSATFWKRCIYAGVGSRVLARRLEIVQQEEAFLAGLLANMGVLVLHRAMPERFDPLVAQCKGDQALLNQLCREKLETDIPEVSALVAEKWRLPPLLAEPIRQQQDSTPADGPMKPLVDAVWGGLLIAEVFVAEDSARAIATVRAKLQERLHFSPAEIEEILEQVGRMAGEAATMLDVPIGAERSYHDILNEAQEVLVALSLQSQQQMQTVQREVELLQVKATTDPLTGAANRARFDEYLLQQFTRAVAYKRPLSVIFIDLDKFKQVNDVHGHQAGDEVLRQVAEILRTSVRNVDLVARYGGEEFAVVLAEADAAGAANRAEVLRAKVEAAIIHFDGKKLRITLSAGVACADQAARFSECTQLTAAADRAVYAAKAGGRNCVRVFKPQAVTAGKHGVPCEVSARA